LGSWLQQNAWNPIPFMPRSMQPTSTQIELLQAVANGLTLKSHRDLEGHKEYRLHTLKGQSTIVVWEDVEALQAAGLIDSNKKFPSATYWLTDTGRAHLKFI
jgi:hypothetical protein